MPPQEPHPDLHQFWVRVSSSAEDRWSVESSSRGEETTERASDPKKLDLVGPSTRSICDPHECSRTYRTLSVSHFKCIAL